MDSESKYLIGMHPDERGKEVGYLFVDDMISKFEDPCGPVYMTDGYRVYNEAFLRCLGEWSIRPYGGRGRPPVWKFGYPDRFNYGQVVKTRMGKRLEKVEYKVVSGTVPDGLLNTSAVERMNLTIRNCMARLKRITQNFSKDIEDLRQSCVLFRVMYNFCRPHMGLGTGSDKVTPAMSLGLTDRVWSLRELMTFSYRENIR